ncbi:cobalamin biosynthesis protein [Klebsiella pneumoniae]|uniref:cobalamin biosynthesis protein n=1 Tax=Klebsiella pneumoniae TaxID=573 RepID=UPI0022216607|nr:cobalamin biosynthesis protein [Klebsiella pneumoniae]
MVGRDTSQLQPAQINRAVVETVAENTVDGIIAPLFSCSSAARRWPWPIKRSNTLDSMVGYKHEKYRAIGMVSARLDDVANFLPARLSWLLLSLAAVLCREDGARALRTGWRDRYQHSSPNCAWPGSDRRRRAGESALACPNDYFGQRVEKPWIGDAVRDIAVDDISRTIRLMWVASSLALALFIGVRYWLVGAA